jgi:hypothetical protein
MLKFLLMIPILAAAIAVYGAPIIVARHRGNKNTAAITALTFVAGWTVLGWVIAFVWAFSGDDNPEIREARKARFEEEVSRQSEEQEQNMLRQAAERAAKTRGREL